MEYFFFHVDSNPRFMEFGLRTNTRLYSFSSEYKMALVTDQQRLISRKSVTDGSCHANIKEGSVWMGMQIFIVFSSPVFIFTLIFMTKKRLRQKSKNNYHSMCRHVVYLSVTKINTKIKSGFLLLTYVQDSRKLINTFQYLKTYQTQQQLDVKLKQILWCKDKKLVYHYKACVIMCFRNVIRFLLSLFNEELNKEKKH